MTKINVTIWNEYIHEQEDGPGAEHIRKIYPKGIHRYLAEHLAADDLTITPVSLDQPEQGLPDDLLNRTDGIQNPKPPIPPIPPEPKVTVAEC